MLRRVRNALSRGAVIAASLVVPGCIGWASASLPPPLTDAEHSIVDGARLPLTVGVAPHVFPAYSDALVDALRGTELFDRVDPLESYETQPDLISRVDRRIHGTAVLPVWTLLTFGVIPSSVDEEHGFSFWLEDPGTGARRHVECSHVGRTTFGWVALFEAVLPDRTVFPFGVDSSRRMRQRLSLEVLRHRAELVEAQR